MRLRSILLQICLWWAVIGYSLWVGGTVFHMLVIVPLWSASPPESVRAFFGGTDFNQTVWNFFGPPWMIVRNVPVIAALLLAWNIPAQRRLLIVSTACMVSILIYTLIYIYPINTILMTQAGGNGTAEEIRTMVNDWIFADRLRFVIGMIGYIALLNAFRLPR